MGYQLNIGNSQTSYDEGIKLAMQLNVPPDLERLINKRLSSGDL